MLVQPSHRPFVRIQVLRSIFFSSYIPSFFFSLSLPSMLLCTCASHERRREATLKEELLFLSNQNYI